MTGGRTVKKVAILLSIMLIFSGCAAESKSAIYVSESDSNAIITDNNRSYEHYNNLIGSDSSINYCFAYADENRVYIALRQDNKSENLAGRMGIAVYDSEGKIEVIPDAVSPYFHDETMYYTYWEGTTGDSCSLIKRENGKATVIAENISEVFYGNDSLLYTNKKDGQTTVCSLKYDDQSAKIFTAISSNGFFIEEYDNYYLFESGYPDFKIQRFIADKNKFETLVNGELLLLNQKGFTYSNNNKMLQYDTATGESAEICPYYAGELKYINQTSRYYFYVRENTICRADANFQNEKVIVNNIKANGINISDGRVFVRYYPQNSAYTVVSEINEDGEILRTFA